LAEQGFATELGVNLWDVLQSTSAQTINMHFILFKTDNEA